MFKWNILGWKLKLRILPLKWCKNQWKKCNWWNFRINLKTHSNIIEQNIFSVCFEADNWLKKKQNTKHGYFLLLVLLLSLHKTKNVENNISVVTMSKQVPLFFVNSFNIDSFRPCLLTSSFYTSCIPTQQSIASLHFINRYHVSYFELKMFSSCDFEFKICPFLSEW